MTSVAFDEELLRRMSDLVVAVNRRRHAEGAAGSGDPTRLRVLAAEEERAEQACVAALTTRGWRSPYALPRGA